MKTITEKFDIADKQTDLSIFLSPEGTLKGRYQQQQSNPLQPLLKDTTVLDTRNIVFNYIFGSMNVQYVMLKILFTSEDETSLYVNQNLLLL